MLIEFSKEWVAVIALVVYVFFYVMNTPKRSEEDDEFNYSKKQVEENLHELKAVKANPVAFLDVLEDLCWLCQEHYTRKNFSLVTRIQEGVAELGYRIDFTEDQEFVYSKEEQHAA